MRYKTLGRTGLRVSSVALGTWAIGGKNWGNVDDTESINAIHRMLELGVNFVDCAPTYGKGHAEEILGQALAGRRDKVTLLTKCGIRWPDENKKNFNQGAIRDSSRASLIKQIDDSLRRLKTDYIDVYMIHWPDVNTPLEETVDALNEIKKAGKIRFTGVSNFDEPLLSQLYELNALDVVQFPYSMVNRSRVKELRQFHSKGVGTMSYGSLGAGILTGTIRELPKFAADDARLGFYDFFVEPKFSMVMELLKTMDKVAESRGVPVAQVAVNWNVQNEFITTSIMGVRNRKEAEENCAAFDWELSPEEMDVLNRAIMDSMGSE
ncbi:MAG: aldo/keto reductase [Oscillospiraceae bacterium]|nr:aldo/keto reductase [Oscillospiraceae bacterium]